MAFNDEGGVPATMLVGPQGGANGFGGDWAWIILLLLLGWGNNGFGNGFGGGSEIYPWMNQANLTSSGFQNALMNDNLTQIQNGISGISTQLYSSQIADMQSMNALQAQLAQCCCDNRASIADLKYTVATENCADRAAINDALRDVIAANTASTQRILDQLCQDKIDAKNEEIANLRTQLNMANLAASQGAQTARILADNAAQTTMLEQYLAPTPRPAYVVQNPNCCASACGVNCGCGVA